jgi:type VI secretion system ImpA family protein
MARNLISVIEKIIEATPDNVPRQNLRYDAVYDKIKDARTEEAELDMGVWEHELKKAEWGVVCSVCEGALTNQTNDLQIVVWLCEAWCQQEYWEGLRAAFLFINAFVQKCWENCYPLISGEELESGIEHRGRILEWFVNKIGERIMLLPLNRPSTTLQTNLDLASWINARNLDLVERRSGKVTRDDSEVMTLQKFRRLLKQIPYDRVSEIRDVIDFVGEQVRELESFLIERCMNQEPSFAQLKEMLSNITDLCEFVTKKQKIIVAKPTIIDDGSGVYYEDDEELDDSTEQKVIEEIEISNKDLLNEDDDEDSAEDANNMAGDSWKNEGNQQQTPASIAIIAPTAPTGKANAYETLNALADYLLEEDAHSPAPYIIKLASGWHGKSLPDLLDDITTGQTSGHRILKMLSELARNV